MQKTVLRLGTKLHQHDVIMTLVVLPRIKVSQLSHFGAISFLVIGKFLPHGHVLKRSNNSLGFMFFGN